MVVGALPVFALIQLSGTIPLVGAALGVVVQRLRLGTEGWRLSAVEVGQR